MAYQQLLFDIDDTLLNFQSAEKQALTALFQELQRPLSTATFEYYHKLNAHLWAEFELGHLTKSELLLKRFVDLFHHLGDAEVDGAKMEQRYRHYLAMGHEPMPHAVQLLSDLHQNHDLYVVTNGVAKTQEKRLSEAHFNHYFQQVFISELVGAQKPEPAFFDRVTAQINDFTPQTALVIGDSLSSDIKGAVNFGLDSVWFNPTHKSNESGVKPTYEIDQLLDLEAIVG